MKNINYNRLSESSIFSGLSPSQIKSILPCITSSIKEYKKGSQIFSKGDRASNLGVVLSGEISVCKSCADGHLIQTESVGPAELLGESLAFSTGGEMTHDLIALTDCAVLYLVPDFFMRPCGADCPNKDSHGEVMRNMLRILSDRTQSLGRKIAYLSAPDLKTKLAMYIYDMHTATGLITFNLPLNRDGLAVYLSVARPSLSRDMINLKKLGLIDFYRSSVTIKNLPELFKLAYSADSTSK